jgi:hypothetical protein
LLEVLRVLSILVRGSLSYVAPFLSAETTAETGETGDMALGKGTFSFFSLVGEDLFFMPRNV